MSWNDYYLRRDVLDAVLEQAKRDPAGDLPFDEVPHAADLFGTREQLLLALNYRWTQLMTGYLRAEAAEPEAWEVAPGNEEPDYTDRVADAWRKAASEHSTLRAVLDANIERHPRTMQPALEREQRLLALTAGLAEAYEPAAEVTRVGAAFMALTRHRGVSPVRRANPVGNLLRKLNSA